MAQRKKAGVSPKTIKWIWGVVFAPFALLAVMLLLTALGLFGRMPSFEELENPRSNLATEIYSEDGKVIGSFFVQNRSYVQYEDLFPADSAFHIRLDGHDMPPIVAALIATEDARFRTHSGIDIPSLARVAVKTVLLQNTSQGGGSTITQQFVRNTVLADEANESTLKRKVREAYISLELEKMFSKDEILQMYLNTINYGQGAYGIEAASQLYFSKPAKDLTLPEAATLIGIPQSPTYNNPVDNPENCLARRNLVLDRMLSNNYITQEEHDKAQQTPLTLNITREEETNGIMKYDYFTSYVRDTLLQDYSVIEVFKGGLNVKTTLDPHVQDLAEEAVNRKLNSLPENLECALVAIDPDTGFIQAMVGGRDYKTNEFNLATQAKRQAGSSFKTFTLLAALDEGYSPEGEDRQLGCGELWQCELWYSQYRECICRFVKYWLRGTLYRDRPRQSCRYGT